jgi:hypothetical protein
VKLEAPARIELATLRLGNECSIQLSYGANADRLAWGKLCGKRLPPGSERVAEQVAKPAEKLPRQLQIDTTGHNRKELKTIQLGFSGPFPKPLVGGSTPPGACIATPCGIKQYGRLIPKLTRRADPICLGLGDE